MSLFLSALNVIGRVELKGKFIGKGILLTVLITLLLISYSISKSQESPHSAMEANPEDEGNCIICHSEVPKEGEKSPYYFLNFEEEPSQVCLVCHSESQHVGSKKHLSYVNPEGSNLPGAEGNKIACFTCHDPHPQGVIKGRTVYEAHLGKHEKDFIKRVTIPEKEVKVSLTEKTKVRLRIPLEGNKLCKTCHAGLN